MATAAIILAAGKGTRMKSDLPKALHRVCGVPMVELVAEALRGAGVERIIMVIGFNAEAMRKAFDGKGYEFAVQSEQLGTGHAAMMAAPLLEGFEGSVLVTPGDTPLLDRESLRRLISEHERAHSLMTVASFRAADPTGYGRVVRDQQGEPSRIVEHKDCSPDELTLHEVNSAVYCIDNDAMQRALPNLGNANSQGEYYLTDVLAFISNEGRKTHAVCFEDGDIFRGVNDRWQLAQASSELRHRLLKAHSLAGVTIVDPESTWIGPHVRIGGDTVIHPFTVIDGPTLIGTECEIGPNTKIDTCDIGHRVEIVMSHLRKAKLEDGSRCGPFANLRPKAHLGPGTKIGNFVEVKNAVLGEKVSVSHLTYIGDASIGRGSNIGAGTITCNYDGYRKHRTEIGDNAFVGSNSTLVAPIRIGSGAFIGAGSVITKDVADDALAIGRANQVEKEQWAVRWRKINEASKE